MSRPAYKYALNAPRTVLKGLICKTAHAALGLACLLGPLAAHAQTFNTGPLANNEPLGDNALCVGATGAGGAGTTVGNVDIPIIVNGINNVTDVNLGLLIDHTWRGDLDIQLISPDGSVSRRLITTDTGNTGNDDNYNIELGDEAAIVVNTGTGGQNALNNTSLPPYQFLVAPNLSLGVFNGLATPNGSWTLRICDDYSGQNGTFLRATLFFNNQIETDLELTATASNFYPTTGNSVTLTYTLQNLGLRDTSDVTVDIALPAGLVLTGQGGTGTYSAATGLWTIPGAVGREETITKTLTVTVQGTGPYDTIAEIASSAVGDVDSTVANGVTTEDDYAEVTIFPLTPVDTPPTLNCPAADRVSFIWGAPGTPNGWSTGTGFVQSYSAGGIDFDVSISGDRDQFIVAGGSLTPATSTTVTGGNTSGTDYGLFLAVNNDNIDQSVIVEIDLGTAGVGIEGVQIPIFDVDNGTWVDRITVTGFVNDVAVTPILSSGASNTVSGNSVIGTQGADNTTDLGNMYLSFLSPIDKVLIDYGNAPSAQADPTGQVIKISHITMCPRRLADLSAVKTVEVYDPDNLGLYMVPGNEVLYKITATNASTADASAQDLVIEDTLPTNLKFVSATTTGFTGGAFGSPDLPDPNQDCGVTTCVIRYSGADLPIGETGEVIVRALIK